MIDPHLRYYQLSIWSYIFKVCVDFDFVIVIYNTMVQACIVVYRVSVTYSWFERLINYIVYIVLKTC